MKIRKETMSLGMPWEKEYGYSQAVKVDNTVYLSGQVSHDGEGNIVGVGDMEAQMRQAYANVEKVLAHYGATLENMVEEVLYVTDMEAAFAARALQQVSGDKRWVASTIVQIPRLAFPELLVEIKGIAKLK